MAKRKTTKSVFYKILHRKLKENCLIFRTFCSIYRLRGKSVALLKWNTLVYILLRISYSTISFRNKIITDVIMSNKTRVKHKKTRSVCETRCYASTISLTLMSWLSRQYNKNRQKWYFENIYLLSVKKWSNLDGECRISESLNSRYQFGLAEIRV